MTIQLIHGEFKSSEAIDLISQMINVKIKYHENKINNLHNEEDIKTRENKIKQLQETLNEFREKIDASDENIVVESSIQIN